jgi:hypothetical protein
MACATVVNSGMKMLPYPKHQNTDAVLYTSGEAGFKGNTLYAHISSPECRPNNSIKKFI